MLFSPRPPRTSRCEVWSRPPCAIGRPSTTRTAVTSAVSRIGTARIEQRQQQRRDRRLGHLPARRQAERGEHEAEHLAPRVAHEHGRRLARAEVEGQEAERRAADREREHEQQALLVQVDGVDREERRRRRRRASPARPSMLSRRLKAFVIPTSQSPPRIAASTPLETISTRRPDASTTAAAPTWAASLTSARCGCRSSRSPAAKTIAAPPRMPKSSELPPTARAARASSTATAKPAKIPTPPSVGVAVACQRSPVGAVTKRAATRERRSPQIVSAAIGAATRQMIALTAPPPPRSTAARA